MSATVEMLEGPPGVGPAIEGEALVSADAFSPRYDLDRATGVISRAGHAIEGESLVGRILVVPAAKGGVAAGWAFHDIVQRGVGPAGLLCRETNPVFVQGAVLAGLPLLHRLAPDPLTTLRSGDRLRVEPEKGRVTILRRA